MFVLIMGVSGVGKTTIGRELATQLGWTFLDADDDHSSDAITRMAAGTPLTEAERGPWLERVRSRVIRHIEQGDNVVLACSALRHTHRKYLRQVPGEVMVVQLVAPPAVIAGRLQERGGHFAGVELLGDQLSTFEPARDAITIDASHDVQTVVTNIMSAMAGPPRGATAAPIEDYAVIGDTFTAALVSRNGAIDWLCLPRFDAAACFAALLGDDNNGTWRIAPAAGAQRVERAYRRDTLVLETEFTTETGRIRLIDFMPPHETQPNIVRIVEGVDGEVEMSMQLVIRFDYGWVVPWVQTVDGRLHAVGGPDALVLDTPIKLEGQQLTTIAKFVVREGERVPFVLNWHSSTEPAPPPLDAELALRYAEDWWHEWVSHCTYDGPWRDAVVRSLITLKALTYSASGGIAAAVTTSLPEHIGGVRNWDYRYSWLRDATFTLYALLSSGYKDEAIAWRNWLLRAVAGDPSQLQIMYGLDGERRLPELTLDWLPGYEGSSPVRIGNAAVKQLQLDVYGEVMDVLFQARKMGVPPDPYAWKLQRRLLEFLATKWHEPDEGLWEVRAERQNFTHSKVMAWVAFDRAVKSAERFGLDGDVDRWRELRARIHAEVCERGFDQERFTFTQSYESKNTDAALLMIPLLGFLPPDDPRVAGTVRAIEEDLVVDGLVLRYRTDQTADGLPPGEGVFMLCSFWLADNYELLGRHDEARALFERLLSLRNDVGLLSEQYDTAAGRMLGNFPQAFSHVGLVNTALNLSPNQPTPARERERA